MEIGNKLEHPSSDSFETCELRESIDWNDWCAALAVVRVQISFSSAGIVLDRAVGCWLLCPLRGLFSQPVRTIPPEKMIS